MSVGLVLYRNQRRFWRVIVLKTMRMPDVFIPVILIALIGLPLVYLKIITIGDLLSLALAPVLLHEWRKNGNAGLQSFERLAYSIIGAFIFGMGAIGLLIFIPVMLEANGLQTFWGTRLLESLPGDTIWVFVIIGAVFGARRAKRIT